MIRQRQDSDQGKTPMKWRVCVGNARLLMGLVLAGAVLFGLTGCANSAHQPVANRAGQIRTPAPSQPPPTLAQLPVSPTRERVTTLSLEPPDGGGRQTRQTEAFPAGERQTGEQTASVDSTGDGDQGDQGVEPASPLDEVNSSTEGVTEAPVDPQLRTNAEGELQAVTHDLPLTVNDTVLSFLNYFQTPRGRAIVETGLRRAGRYRPMIERVLREEGLPTDLMYMAQAESAFQPQALSKAGARGLWQFMSFRGKEYGLEHSWWVDDRQDPEKATRAAAHHLRDLYQMFGDWYLVMAAYNSGPGTVQHAIERTGYADFWEFYKLNALPKETRNYVPIILALTLIAKDPARYGMDVEPEEPLSAENVQPGHPVDLRLVAETIDVDVDTLRSLNPQLLRLVTPADPAFVLHVPEGTAERFDAEMAAIPTDKWATWRRHRVEDGETISGIAQKYGVTAAAIADVNSLDAHAPLTADLNLIIPVVAPSQSTLGELERYRARRTDTLASIADEFDVTVAELKKWNRLRGNQVAAGTRLKIYLGGAGAPPTETKRVASTGSTPAAKPRQEPQEKDKPVAQAQTTKAPAVMHRVQAGETLWSIARAYQTTVAAIQAGNQFLFSRPLQAGDMLTISPSR